MTDKEKQSLKIRLGRRLSSDRPEVMEIVKEEIDKTPIYDIIDNAPIVEPEKVLFANVTFDEDKLKEIVQAEVIDKIKSGELVLKDERPQGEWIKTIYGFYTCSNCDNYGNPNYFNFCPKCGAEMRGGAES